MGVGGDPDGSSSERRQPTLVPRPAGTDARPVRRSLGAMKFRTPFGQGPQPQPGPLKQSLHAGSDMLLVDAAGAGAPVLISTCLIHAVSVHASVGAAMGRRMLPPSGPTALAAVLVVFSRNALATATATASIRAPSARYVIGTRASSLAVGLAVHGRAEGMRLSFEVGHLHDAWSVIVSGQLRG